MGYAGRFCATVGSAKYIIPTDVTDRPASTGPSCVVVLATPRALPPAPLGRSACCARMFRTVPTWATVLSSGDRGGVFAMPTRGPLPGRLSARQRRVLELSATGATVAEVATRLDPAGGE